MILTKMHLYLAYMAGQKAKANESTEPGPNDEEQIAARKYEEEVKQFTANKAKFAQILARDPQEWEKLAEPVIGGNEYLGIAWSTAKLAKSLEDQKNRMGGKSGPELQRMQQDMQATAKELRELEDDLKKRMEGDKSEMPQLPK